MDDSGVLSDDFRGLGDERRGDEGEPGSESVAVEYKHKHAKKQSFRPSN